VLVQHFYPSLRPSEVMFDRMAIWIRTHDLPFGLMNNKWGWKLTEKVRLVLKVEADSHGRAWGPYLRAKVQIYISKPLLRCVSVFSEKKQITERFDVKYEKLLNYCYSCGIIGHSFGFCPSPVERDNEGMLSYDKDLRASEDGRFKRAFEDKKATSAGDNFSLGGAEQFWWEELSWEGRLRR
jgi:hypothetical protein